MTGHGSISSTNRIANHTPHRIIHPCPENWTVDIVLQNLILKLFTSAESELSLLFERMLIFLEILDQMSARYTKLVTLVDQVPVGDSDEDPEHHAAQPGQNIQIALVQLPCYSLMMLVFD
jgi:hypothetical protein